MSTAISPLAPTQCPRNARHRRRKTRDRRGRHPLQGPYRRAAGGAGQGHRGGRRLHQIEMPLRAGGMVPRQAETRRSRLRGAGGEFRQRQRLHRQDGQAGNHADGIDRRQGRRLQAGRHLSRLHRGDRRAARRHQIRRRARHAGAERRAGRLDGRRESDHDHRHLSRRSRPPPRSSARQTSPSTAWPRAPA